MDKSDISFEEYYEDVLRFLRGLSIDEYLAEELTQETFEDYEAQEKLFVQAIADKEMARQVHRILHELKEPYKEIFSLRTFS